MARQEYRIVPAPTRARRKAPGSDETARFVSTLEEEVNRMAAAGWAFLRTEVMTFQRRKGLFGRTEESRTLLVFARDTAPSPDDPVETDAGPVARRPRPIGPALRANRERTRPEGPKLVGAAPRDRDDDDPI